jgi:hypothetical protein
VINFTVEPGMIAVVEFHHAWVITATALAFANIFLGDETMPDAVASGSTVGLKRMGETSSGGNTNANFKLASPPVRERIVVPGTYTRKIAIQSLVGVVTWVAGAFTPLTLKAVAYR